MNVRSDIRIPLILIFEILLVLMLGILNDVLAPYSVSVIAPALLLVAPCMFLKLLPAALCVFIGGYFFEAFLPVRSGAVVALLLLGCAAGVRFAPRLMSLGKPAIALVFGGINAAIFILGAAFLPMCAAGLAEHAQRLFVDFLVSELFMAGAVPFAMEVCDGVCMIMGIDKDYYGRI